MLDNFTNSSFVAPINSSFGIVDYVLFAAFLGVSLAVGLFFSIRGQKTTSQYFHGDRQMGPIPIGISTGVSFLSSAALVGMSAEIYHNGYSIIVGAFSGPVVYFTGCCIISHLVHSTGITSLAEYFNKRFKSPVLTYLLNIMVLLCILEYMGTCTLGSVIALNSITGGKVSIIVGLIIGGSVATCYTTIGGLKAVVWTDVIQFVIMLVGILGVIIQSIVDTPGGMSKIIEQGLSYKRIHPIPTSTDFTIRHTLWGLMIGKGIAWGIWCAQPACVQRLSSTSCRRDSIIVAGIAAGLFVCFSLLPSWAGLNIFGYYTSRGCDIYAAGWIKNNEVLVYYVRERLNWPGFQGLLMAALYAGSMSSLSSGLNSASALMWKDAIKPLLRVEVSESKAMIVSRVLVVAFGVVGMLWCYALYSTGGLILQVSTSIEASMYGAYFSMLFLSLFFPNVNTYGVMSGLVVSFSITLWLGIGSLLYGKSTVTNLPTTVEMCHPDHLNIKARANSTIDIGCQKSFLQTFYSISYAWYAAICILTSVTVALLVSSCTKPRRVSRDDEKLLSPLCRPGFCRRLLNVRDDSEDVSEDFSENVQTGDKKIIQSSRV